MAATEQDGRTAARAERRATSITALQCELRTVFADHPSNRAIAEALRRIGTRLEATYAVLHTRLGVHLLSEEWLAPGTEVGAQMREQVNTALWEAVSSEETRCTRLSPNDDQQVVASVVMYDHDIQPSGGAALVLRNADRSRLVQVMAQLEGLFGSVMLLLGEARTGERRVAERKAVLPSAAATHPVRLAHAILSELEQRYGFEMAAIGFVHGDRVEIAAISGVGDLRPANPGVAAIRAAMEECLDHGAAVVHAGGEARDGQDDCRLHAQWSVQAGGNPVASIPLFFLEQVAAVVSMSQGAGTPLTRENVALVAEELANYATLVPLSRAANRGLAAHAWDSVRGLAKHLAGSGRRRTVLGLACTALLGGWLAFGELTHDFTVPCVVQAADRRTVSCPRSGVLAELFVRPGDRVRAGQLLAAIDASDDFLRRAEIAAEIESLDALVDQAVARREAGLVRVHEARRRSLKAQLVIVDASIAQAQIRAPQDGLILSGDLRERLGGRIEMGTPMFELARYDRAAVVLRIPEKLVLAAGKARSARFATSARPEHTMELGRLAIAPASTVVDERNVFLAEATVAIDLAELPPGMEGTVHIDAGPRSAFWVLTHRITDWLRMHYWL